MKARRIGLIGCGTIGSQLALSLDAGKIPNAMLVSLFDVVPDNMAALRAGLSGNVQAFADFEKFLDSGIDVVVEAASQKAVQSFAKAVVSAGKDMMIMSVGALADPDAFEALVAVARQAGSRLYLPTGAIAGIDAIRSVRGLIDTLTLTTTKNPKALAGAPFFDLKGMDPDSITRRTEIFTGSAIEAVRLFPANVNVAAILSIAGIGPARTRVSIVADPEAKTNRHEITAAGSFGEICISVNNLPSPGNPKTSYLAGLSAIECLRSICDDSVRVGT